MYLPLSRRSTTPGTEVLSGEVLLNSSHFSEWHQSSLRRSKPGHSLDGKEKAWLVATEIALEREVFHLDLRRFNQKVRSRGGR